MISVAIIDDHKVVADGLERIINASGEAYVCGKAYDAAGCRKLLTQQLPDVLLLDVSLPDGNGIDLCREIKKQHPSISILMLTMYAEQTIVRHSLNAGASGYVLKSIPTEEILKGIEEVAAGRTFVCDEINMILRNVDTFSELTYREREVLKYIVQELTCEQIAKKMFLSFDTIRGYRKNLYLKLDVHNTAALIKLALEKGLV